MKRILSILLLLSICFLSKGQSNGDPAGFPTVNSAPYYKYNGYLQVADGKAFIFGSTDTAWHPRFAGTTVYKSSDSTIYLWTGNIWQSVGSGGSGGSETLQQVIINGSHLNQNNLISIDDGNSLIISAIDDGLGDSTYTYHDKGFWFAEIDQVNEASSGLGLSKRKAYMYAMGSSGNVSYFSGQLNIDTANGAQYNESGARPATGIRYTNTDTSAWDNNTLITKRYLNDRVGGGATTIYTGDGTLGGDRTVDMDSHSLTFSNGNFLEISTPGALIDVGTGNLISLQSADGSYNFTNLQTSTTPDYIATWSSNILSKTLVSDILTPVSSSGNYYQFVDSTNTPPVSFPTGFDTLYYMVGGAGTGIFSGNNYKIARYVSNVFDAFITPTLNDVGFVLTGTAANTWHRYNNSTWPRTNSGLWGTAGNLGGGILGSTDNSNVFLKRNNTNLIILQGGGVVRFPQLGGVASGLMGLATGTGNASNVQIGSGLSLVAGVLSATGSGGTVTSVAATVTNTGLAVSGSPITGAGTLAFTWTGAVQGDLPYFSATNTLSFLNKNTTATRYLSNQGTSNSPSWNQVDLTNGVTGTLPFGNVNVPAEEVTTPYAT